MSQLNAQVPDDQGEPGLPSGRFRARVAGPDGRYVSAPKAFANRTDASLWVDVRHADLIRGAWWARLKRSASPSITTYVGVWMEEYPTAREWAKELYRGLLRTCITPTLGQIAVGSLSLAAVRRRHHRLGERRVADARQGDGSVGGAWRAGSSLPPSLALPL
ncbi:MAG: hypothetical protein LH645_02855 [Actinomycetia bacterium]|nr:hypothetical protein [Actinomycetes bacterium]